MTTDCWLSIHVFLSDRIRTEDFLCSWLRPRVIELERHGRTNHFFFIRYWEGGPHLRLRWRGLSDADRMALLGALDPSAWTSADPPTAGTYYRHHGLDGRRLPLESLPWYGEGAVALIPYEPEIRRYGGPAALEANQTLFALSSRVALAVIGATRGDIQKRAALASALMLEAARAACDSTAGLQDFFRRYAEYWAQYSDQTRALWKTLAVQDPTTDPASAGSLQVLRRRFDEGGASASPGRSAIALWERGVNELLGRLQALCQSGMLISPLSGRPVRSDEAFRAARTSIVYSQIHMLNNRLGLTPAVEICIAAFLAAFAARWPEMTVSRHVVNAHTGDLT